MKARLLVPLGALALLAAACAGSGNPESFQDQDQIVRQNFIEACQHAGEEIDDPAIQTNLDDVCECSYESVESEISFEEFTDVDDALRDDINATIPANIRNAIAGCIRDIAGVEG